MWDFVKWAGEPEPKNTQTKLHSTLSKITKLLLQINICQAFRYFGWLTIAPLLLLHCLLCCTAFQMGDKKLHQSWTIQQCGSKIEKAAKIIYNFSFTEKCHKPVNPCTFSSLAVLLGKRLQNGLKNAISYNWLKTHPKVVNTQNKCLVHHFGGISAFKVVSVFVLASKVSFFGT